MRRGERWTYAGEFDEDYNVPVEVARLIAFGSLVDASWHNDVSPSFYLGRQHGGDVEPNEETARLWIEHPDPEVREFPEMARFTVIFGHEDTEVRYEGDSLRAALMALGVPDSAISEGVL